MLQSPESAPPIAACPPSEIDTALVEDLRQTLGPIAQCTRTALAHLRGPASQWLVDGADCPCSQQLGTIACLHGEEVAGRHLVQYRLTCDGKESGSILACCPSSARALEPALQRIVHSCLRQREVQKEQRVLLSQLGASWESLQAVYDIGFHLRTVTDVQELLDRILSKVTAKHDQLRALLWLEGDGQLEPVARKNTSAGEPRRPDQGLLGQIMKQRGGTLINGAARLAAVAPSEPELQDAGGVAIVPIATHQGVLGALEVWQEPGQPDLDDSFLDFLETLALLAAMVVENDRLRRSSVESERLRRDIEIGSRIQQTLLVGRPPLDMQMIQAAAITIPSWQIDGDFYDFFTHDRVLDVVVGDVMGKGIPAALVGVATKNHFLRAQNYLLGAHPTRLPEPKDILSIVNAELVKQLIGIESYVTLVYARFDLKSYCLELIDCGHTKAVHSSTRTGKYAFLQGQNMPLGFSQGENYEKVSVPFEPGDVFFFYSDGVTEAKNAAGKYYGEQRLAELIHAHNRLEPKQLIDKVRQEIMAFAQSKTFLDDLTCVAVKIQDVHATVASNRASLTIASDLQELPRVRAFVREVCGRNFDLEAIAESLDQVECAVTEAIRNIVVHAYQGQSNQQIRLETDLFVNRLSVRIFHRGEQFAADVAKTGMVDGPPEGGELIRQCVERVKYYRAKHGENCVDLVKLFRQGLKGGAHGHNS